MYIVNWLHSTWCTHISSRFTLMYSPRHPHGAHSCPGQGRHQLEAEKLSSCPPHPLTERSVPGLVCPCKCSCRHDSKSGKSEEWGDTQCTVVCVCVVKGLPSSGVEEGKDILLSDGEPWRLHVLYPHVLQLQCVFQLLFLLNGIRNGNET